MDSFGNFLIFAGTEELGNDNPGTVGKTHEEADQHIDNGSYRTNGRKSFIGHKVADNPGIHHVVELLENIA